MLHARRTLAILAILTVTPWLATAQEANEADGTQDLGWVSTPPTPAEHPALSAVLLGLRPVSVHQLNSYRLGRDPAYSGRARSRFIRWTRAQFMAALAARLWMTWRGCSGPMSSRRDHVPSAPARPR